MLPDERGGPRSLYQLCGYTWIFPRGNRGSHKHIVSPVCGVKLASQYYGLYVLRVSSVPPLPPGFAVLIWGLAGWV